MSWCCKNQKSFSPNIYQLNKRLESLNKEPFKTTTVTAKKQESVEEETFYFTTKNHDFTISIEKEKWK